jgi:hypothetical protein
MKRLRLAAGNSGMAERTPASHSSRDLQRQQVGFGEVAVVVRLLLAAHGEGLAEVHVVQPRFLPIFSPDSISATWRATLVVDRLLHEAERVQVLQLGLGAELPAARAAVR